MREYRINMSMWGISKWAYEELRAFCRQYPEKKAEANALLGVKSSCHVVEYREADGQMAGTVMPRVNTTSNPVEDTIMKRLHLLEDCDLIDRVAAEAVKLCTAATRFAQTIREQTGETLLDMISDEKA